MQLTRLAALVAVPAALSLAACGGGSSGVLGGNPTGQTANIRFVNGATDLGSNVDFYFQPTGAAAPSAPAAPGTTNVPYGEVTTFVQEAPTAATVTLRATGSPASGPALQRLACPIPQMSANAKYTFSVSGTGAIGYQCLIFQDFDYATSPQYRVHNASLNAPATIAYNVTTTPAGATAPFVSSQVAARGGNATAGSATYTQVQPAGPIAGATSNPSFVVGPNSGAATFPVFASVDAMHLFASGSLTQPNTAGSLNFPSTAGTSVFAIDCTAASVAALPGVQCTSGVALIGTFDTL